MANIVTVVWCELYVEDMQRAVSFYNEVFQTELSKLPNPTDDGSEMMAFPMEENGIGASGALVKMPGVSPGNNSTILYFGSENCAIEEARVAAAGGTVTQSKLSIGEFGFITLCVDTEGNTFGIHSMN